MQASRNLHCGVPNRGCSQVPKNVCCAQHNTQCFAVLLGRGDLQKRRGSIGSRGPQGKQSLRPEVQVSGSGVRSTLRASGVGLDTLRGWIRIGCHAELWIGGVLSGKVPSTSCLASCGSGDLLGRDGSAGKMISEDMPPHLAGQLGKKWHSSGKCGCLIASILLSS